MMTTQTLNKYCMQMKQSDPAFLSRWLHGKLSQEELASMRNREDYEEMLQESEGDDSDSDSENENGSPNKKDRETEEGPSGQSPLHKFLAMAVMLLFDNRFLPKPIASFM